MDTRNSNITFTNMYAYLIKYPKSRGKVPFVLEYLTPPPPSPIDRRVHTSGVCETRTKSRVVAGQIESNDPNWSKNVLLHVMDAPWSPPLNGPTKRKLINDLVPPARRRAHVITDER